MTHLFTVDQERIFTVAVKQGKKEGKGKAKGGLGQPTVRFSLF